MYIGSFRRFAVCHGGVLENVTTISEMETNVSSFSSAGEGLGLASMEECGWYAGTIGSPLGSECPFRVLSDFF